MASRKISQLPAAGALTGAELVEAVQGGQNVRTTTQDIADLGGGGGGGAVDSVNGQTGVVVLDAGDISVTPTGNLSSTDVQAALAELDSDIAAGLAGLKWKAPVRVATTTAGTLATSFENGDTVDGVVLATGNRILLKNQTSQTDNGIYDVSASGAPTRSTDANSASELEGAAVSVLEGTANANTTWLQTTDNITLGVSNIVWGQFGSSVPDADASTKGIAKLYTTPYGTNTDGAPDQNSVKGAFRRVRSVTGASACVQADDNGLILFNSASPFTFTLDQLTANVAGNETTKINYINIGAGAVTLSNGSGVTMAGITTIPGATGTNYPSGVVYFDTATTPRHVTATYDDDLIAIAALAPANDDFIQRKAGVWTNRTVAQVRTDLLTGIYTVIVTICSESNTGIVLTDQPNSRQFLKNQGVYRKQFDATNYRQVRATAIVLTASASVNNPRLIPEYTTDLTGASGWTAIGAATIASGDAISLFTGTANDQVTNWIDLPVGAKADVLFRVAMDGGNSSADPVVGSVMLHFRT